MTVECDVCQKEFEHPSHLKRHLERKNPCSEDNAHEKPHQCHSCDSVFRFASALSRHRKTCKGRKVTVKSLQEDVTRLQTSAYEKELELQERIRELEQVIESGDIAQPEEIGLHITSLGLTLLADSYKPQLYLIIPGPLLIMEQSVTGIVVKFGSSDEPPQRLGRHARDFDGYRLLDSILTNNPKRIESQFKSWLKTHKKLLRGKSERKKTVDTELFEVTSQEDYENVARVAQQLADTYAMEVEAASKSQVVLLNEKNQRELESLRTQLRAMHT